MKTICVGFFLAIPAGFAFAQTSIPPDITPFAGEITLRYAPKFESRCTVKKTEQKPDESAINSMTESETTSVFKDPAGVLKFSMVTNSGVNYFRLTANINEDTSAPSSEAPEITTDLPLSEKELGTVKEFALHTLKKGSDMGLIGKPLRQGASYSFDLCALLPGFVTEKQSGDWKVLGVAVIKGRESIVVGGEQSATCSYSGKQMSFETKGWSSYDRQSGLAGASSAAWVVSIPGKTSGIGSEDQECVIVGELAKPSSATAHGALPAKSTEQRLIELKALLKKGLITREIYQKRSSEIINEM